MESNILVWTIKFPAMLARAIYLCLCYDTPRALNRNEVTGPTDEYELLVTHLLFIQAKIKSERIQFP